jgi:dolichol-phosphate mannosyltransferase
MEKIDYSVVVPVYNEEGNIGELHKQLSKIFEKQSWELILVNDSSKDKSLAIIKNLSEKDKAVKYISFSRNFGHQAALTAGMDYAQGKAIITMDCDLQDPPQIIPEMIRKWKAGNYIVYARRKNYRNDNFLKKWGSKMYYGLLDKFSEVKIPRNVGDFRLVDRKVIDQLKNMKEKARYLRGMVAWLGFKYDFVDYQRPDRKHGESGYTFSKLFRLAMEGILNFSLIPLKAGLLLGIVSIFSGSLFLLYMLLDFLINNQVYQLYKWLAVAMLIMMGFLFMLIWILGEYIGRIYDETRGRPLYVLNDKGNFN